MWDIWLFRSGYFIFGFSIAVVLFHLSAFSVLFFIWSAYLFYCAIQEDRRFIKEQQLTLSRRDFIQTK